MLTKSKSALTAQNFHHVVDITNVLLSSDTGPQLTGRGAEIRQSSWTTNLCFNCS